MYCDGRNPYMGYYFLDVMYTSMLADITASHFLKISLIYRPSVYIYAVTNLSGHNLDFVITVCVYPQFLIICLIMSDLCIKKCNNITKWGES